MSQPTQSQATALNQATELNTAVQFIQWSMASQVLVALFSSINPANGSVIVWQGQSADAQLSCQCWQFKAARKAFYRLVTIKPGSSESLLTWYRLFAEQLKQNMLKPMAVH